MEDILKKLDRSDFIVGQSYKIGKISCRLNENGSGKFYFHQGNGFNSIIYEQCGVTEDEVMEFLGYTAVGSFPEIPLKDIPRIYNWLNERWAIREGLVTMKDLYPYSEFDLGDGEIINFPYVVKSQEDWDQVWPKLKKAGFTWSDGEELNEIFSECHDFPESVDQKDSLKLVIND